MRGQVEFQKGVMYRDGQPEFMLSADYPYYRDDPANWQPRLQQLRALGIQVVTFYVPWRHHEPVEGDLDFAGRTQPNRNAVQFLELIAAEGMLALVKPGPFIHAETDFGGLPDWVEAGERFEPMLGTDKQRHWHRFLPSPVGEAFSAKVLDWFEACLRELIRPYRYPDGPVIALQVLNEGVYSSGNERFTWYDYAEPSLDEYRRRFGAKMVAPKSFTPPSSFDEVLPYLNWGRYQADFMGELYRRYGEPLGESGLPVLTNQNPAHADPKGMDWWIARVNPERWPNVHYGFTNWIGVVSHDATAFNRYLLLCKRQPGPNLEENWGFSELYDSRYRHTVIPYFQTVLAIAAGATGFNVYTGVGTAHWDSHLDPHHQPPYPDSAPIGADGSLHPKAQTLHLLAQYLDRYGAEIATARREAPVSWGLYPPYAALAGWSNEASDWEALGVKPPRCGVRGLDNFQRSMSLESRDFHLLNIEEASQIDPSGFPSLTLCGGFFMDRATQQRLLDYVRGGGTLILCHDMPVRDDLMAPCTILRDGLAADEGKGRFQFIARNPFEDGPSESFLAVLHDMGFARPFAGSLAEAETQAWRLTAATGAEHYFVLSLGEAPGEHRVGPVTVRLPGRSAAMLRVVEGRLTAALVKGVNDCDGSEVVPMAAAGSVRVEGSGPTDLLWTEDGLRVEVRP